MKAKCRQPKCIGLFVCLAVALVVAACKGEKNQEPAAPAQSTGTTAPAPPVVPAPAITQASWAPDALEELLAPIALYPDQLLTQILAASVNAQEVLDAGNWLLENQSLKGEALDAEARKVGFGAAMRALLQFPTVVDMMCQQIDWTRQVGSAFSSDQKSVLDAVQRLRLQAAQVGNLKSTPEQVVETKTESNQTIVEVKPADPQIVYVPQYNPQVVYTTPPPAAPAPAATTTADDPNTVSTGTAVAGGLLAFGAGILLGNALDDDDDDYCCYPNWGHSTVVVGARPFYPPAYAYRPAYGAGFRPAYGYNPPAGYRNRYNQGNNVVINNNDYYNRFSNNQNLRARSTQSPIRGAQTPATRESWRGQSEYRGTRDPATTQRLSQAAERPAAADRTERWQGQSTYRGTDDRAAGQTRSDRMRLADTSDARGSFSAERPVQGSQRSYSDRGYGDVSRPERSAAMEPPAQRELQRPAQTEVQPPTTSLQTAPERSRDSVLGGAQARESGSFDRAASARGRASAGGRGERGGGGRRR